MTFTSGSPAPMTPEAKLANRQWRVLNSWWIFPPILSLGFLGWLGFMIAAIRTTQKKYWIFCGLYASCFLVFCVLVVSFGSESAASNWAIIPFLGSWIAPTIHAAIINRDYLRTLAAKGAWYQSPQNQPVQQQPSDQSQPFMGVSNADFYGPSTGSQPNPQVAPEPTTRPGNPHPSQHTGPAYDPPQSSTLPAQPQIAQAKPVPISIEQATVEQLETVPGVDHALANRLVAIRDARGGYRDLDDLVAAANLQPHELVRLRDHITFTAQAPPQQSQRGQGTGRILDI